MSGFNISNFDLRHLRVFISVVEHEGVSAAALANNVALSTISRDLTSLEARLGVQLCRRGRGGFALTRAGEKIYRAAVDLQERLQVFEFEVQAAKDAIADSFRIGINDHVITSIGSGLIRAMSNMRSMFPDVSMNVSVHQATSIDVLVRERRLDVGVTGQPAWLQPLQYKPMFVEEHRLYISANSPHMDHVAAALNCDPAQINKPIPYVTRAQKTDGFKDFEDGYPYEVVGRCSNLEAVLAVVLSGAGCAFMPIKFVGALERKDLVELPFRGGPQYVQFYIAHRRDMAAQKSVKTFLAQFK